MTFTNKVAAELATSRRAAFARIAVARSAPALASGAAALDWDVSLDRRAALRSLSSYAGLPSSFPILDKDEQLKVCKELLIEEQIDERRLPPRALRAHIDRAKTVCSLKTMKGPITFSTWFVACTVAMSSVCSKSGRRILAICCFCRCGLPSASRRLPSCWPRALNTSWSMSFKTSMSCSIGC